MMARSSTIVAVHSNVQRIILHISPHCFPQLSEMSSSTSKSRNENSKDERSVQETSYGFEVEYVNDLDGSRPSVSYIFKYFLIIISVFKAADVWADDDELFDSLMDIMVDQPFFDSHQDPTTKLSTTM